MVQTSYERKPNSWFIFLVGVIAAFSATKSVVAWLIDDSRLPDDVNIIVTSPIEFILLQFQIAVGFGLVIILIFLILELIRKGSKNEAIQQRLGELNLPPPKFSLPSLLTICSNPQYLERLDCSIHGIFDTNDSAILDR